ncbi:hypothetical protein OsI_37154 [Oryza sativa Indica Group]|uniref:PIR2-like helical domain-containing protein n=2 Tax=Oryza sativa TaxID=4530 RepID=A3CE47_ORYSJ|nr:hypothetical protein OsI_37154 [Oryza sativa Indica Group]EAZ19360.1 hypothetical protein OsJ_34912 [Oryza sativa Japonica Group]
MSDSRKKSYGFSMSHTSFRGLLAFLKLYFPYVTDHQARRYLHIASYNLLLAIHLLRHDRRHLPQTQTQTLLLPLPDGGNIKAALRIAAVQADHPAPDDPTTSSNAPTTCSPPMTSGPSRIYSTPANGRRPTPTSCAANNATCIGGGAFARISIQIMGKYNLSSNSAEASKHPQHTALGSFLLSLSGDGEKLDRLRHLLRSITDGSGRVISDADWEQLNAMMIQERLMITKKIGRKRALPPPSAAPQDLAELSKRRNQVTNLMSYVEWRNPNPITGEVTMLTSQ